MHKVVFMKREKEKEKEKKKKKFVFIVEQPGRHCCKQMIKVKAISKERKRNGPSDRMQ